MRWITPTGPVDLSPNEVAALADVAAISDVVYLNPNDWYPNPVMTIRDIEWARETIQTISIQYRWMNGNTI